jgi:hypothetical protein
MNHYRALTALFVALPLTVALPAQAGETPPWNEGKTLADKVTLEKTTVCTDGKNHYVVLAPDEDQGQRLYYGDGKVFTRVPPPPKMITGNWYLDPRFYNKRHNDSFRGVDLRPYSRVEVKEEKETKKCEASCGERSVQLQVLEATKATELLLAAKFEPQRMKSYPHALMRDETGNYYLVDRGLLPGEEKSFRLFMGPKGGMKQLKMTNVVADSEGEIFSTKNGELRLVVDRSQAPMWIAGKKKLALRVVPVEENLAMIYNDLGIYLGERLGTPCDDL